MKPYVGLFAVIAWLICGFFAWGITLADDRSDRIGNSARYDCRHDQSFAVFWGELGGPLSLAAALAHSGFAEHGMQWTCRAESAAPKE